MADIHDDVRGKLGDVSGFEVGGKLGDVSGEETFEELLGVVTHDQRREILHCLELRVNRLEYQLFAIARWLDLRVSSNTRRLDDDETQLRDHEDRIRRLENPTRGSTS